MKTREQLAARLAELQTAMSAIISANPVTVPKEEQDKFDAYLAEANQIKADEAELTAAEQRAAQNKAALAAIKPIVQPRRAESQSDFEFGNQGKPQERIEVKSEVMTLEEIRVRFANCPEKKPEVLNKKNGGFRSMGEQLACIAQSARNDYQSEARDPRLHWNVVTPSMAVTGAGASVPSDGGYLIQKDIATDFESRMISNGEILKRADMHEITAMSDRLSINLIDETSRVTGSRWGGVQIYWGAEADSTTAQKPKFRQTELILKDLIGLAYVTDRLLMDATALQSIYEKAFMEEFTFVMEDGIFNGVGGGQMLGMLKSKAVVSVARTTTGQIAFDDVLNMYSRLWPRSVKNAVWYINQDCLPGLAKMSLAIGVAGAPAWLPANAAAGQPYSTLMGLPVIATEYSATYGTVGDIVLADLSEYVMIRKGGMRADSSIHVRFINNESTFRWIYRTDGMPKWTVPITPAKGSNSRSPFISLAT